MVKTYQVYTAIDAFIFFLAAILTTASCVLDWWQVNGNTKAVSLTTAKADIGIWTMSLVVVRAGEDIKLGEEGTYEALWTWDEACLACMEASETREEPGSCLQIKFLQAFTVLVPIFALFAWFTLVASLCISKLVLVFGVIFGAFSAIFALLGCLAAVVIETEGLSGSGFMLYAMSTLMIWIGAIFAVQTATQAMPEPQEPPPKYVARFQRAEGGGGTGSPAGAFQGGMTARSGQSSGSDSQVEKVPPTHLQQVLFWSANQDPGDVATRQSIPTEMLEAAFQEIDEDNSGFIVVEELVEALHMCGLNAHPKAVDKIIQDMDKNASGDIDIVEFVEFFRQLEDLSQFHHKAKARAQFCTILCNSCFLVNLISVFVLIMVFVDMEQSDNPDLYKIVNTLLIAMMAGLCVLFTCVIGAPAMRLSFGRHASGWLYFYEQKIIERNSLKPVQGVGPKVKEEEDAAAKKLREAAAAKGGQAQQIQVSPMLALPGVPPTVAAGMLQDHRDDEPPPGVIADRAGNFIRYDPAAYSRAAMKAIEVKQPRNFNPMHVQQVEELPGDPDLNPATMKALPGTATWKSTPWLEIEDRPKNHNRTTAGSLNPAKEVQPLPILMGSSTADLAVEDMAPLDDNANRRITEHTENSEELSGGKAPSSDGGSRLNGH